jgi:predicted transcriptional regulator
VLDLVGTVAPIAVSNAYKAQQMLQNGYAMDSKARRVVDTDTGDAFSKALGFNPAVVAESGRAREEVFNQAAMLRDMKAHLRAMGGWDCSSRTGEGCGGPRDAGSLEREQP